MLALGARDQDVVIRFVQDPHGRLPPPDLVGEFRGHEGFRRAWAAWLEALKDLRVEPEEVTDWAATACLSQHGRSVAEREVESR
jgi:hypothetical protein